MTGRTKNRLIRVNVRPNDCAVHWIKEQKQNSVGITELFSQHQYVDRKYLQCEHHGSFKTICRLYTYIGT